MALNKMGIVFWDANFTQLGCLYPHGRWLSQAGKEQAYADSQNANGHAAIEDLMRFKRLS
jgi:outer membrane protein assembly factor BamD (BamD/ComL family)